MRRTPKKWEPHTTRTRPRAKEKEQLLQEEAVCEHACHHLAGEVVTCIEDIEGRKQMMMARLIHVVQHAQTTEKRGGRVSFGQHSGKGGTVEIVIMHSVRTTLNPMHYEIYAV